VLEGLFSSLRVCVLTETVTFMASFVVLDKVKVSQNTERLAELFYIVIPEIERDATNV
jgi:hypothetical protein